MNSSMNEKTGKPEGMSPEKRALLAERLAGKGGGGKDAPIPRRSGAGPDPLSFAQQRLWLIDRMEPGGATYNVPYAYRLAGPLSMDVLERALSAMVDRHEILRTTFRMAGDAPVQTIGPAVRITPPVRDLRRLGEGDREASLRDLGAAEARRPFDLERGPLMRVEIAKLSDTEHVLFLTFHHIVFDGWSEGIFFRELQTLYQAFSRNERSPLPPLPVRYVDYAAWQRETLRGDLLERQLSYWRGRLGGALPFLDLPLDRMRPPRQSFRGTTRLFTLDAELHRRLVRLGQAEGVTLYMTMLAAFNVLLWKYTGEQDIVVGTPTAGRMRRETEEMIGFFVNTLVMRTDLSGNPEFRELLRRTRELTLGAFENQDLPFEKLVEELHPQRLPAHNPLFQVMFVLQTAPRGDLRLPGISFTKIETDNDTAKFDLTLSLTEKENGLSGWLEGNADVFEYESLARMASRYETLLRGIAADPSRPIGYIPIMNNEEREQVLSDWKGSDVPYPRDSAIHQVFEEHARAHPETTALLWEGDRMTYGDLNRRANKLARHIRSRGVGAETPVGLSLDRSVETIVAILGVLKAGGAYLPIDPAFPAGRKKFLLDESRVPVVLTTELLREGLPPSGAEIISLDAGWPAIDAEEDTDLPPVTEGGSLAYVMYTSGSTGNPKGVCVPHRGVVRLVSGARYAHFGPGEVFMLLAPASFDASTFEIWGPLLNGATLALAPPGSLSLEDLASAIGKFGVTTIWLTAPLFHQMVDGPIGCFSGVRQLLAGGDVLSVPHVNRFIARHPGCRLVNGYGPTENTTFTCCYEVRGAVRAGSTVPIGRPVENTTVYILDEFFQPVPIGVPGELFAGGDGLARGYLNRPALTAERFVPSPFDAAGGARLYRTGDRARFLPDGNIEFMGRRDTQVKLRGYRIELGEVESVMCEHPAVAESAAIVREDVPGDRRLVAYWVPRAGEIAEEKSLRSHAKSRLPEYMIPSAFVRLDALPSGGTGKIDRDALPAPGTGDYGGEGSHPAEGATPTEKALRAIWADILHMNVVATDRSFFELGGHSLLAMQVITRIRESFRVELPLMTLFEHPTIASLALVIEEKLTEEIENMSDEEASRLSE